MAHLVFENNLNELARMDAPIQRGPMMRWQRKAMEAGVRTLSIDNNTNSNPSPRRSTKTPGKTPKTPLSSKLSPRPTPTKTPGGKTPGKKKGLTGKTPKKTPKSPHCSEDRFIPNRSSMDMELSHHMVMSENLAMDAEPASPASQEFHSKMTSVLKDGLKVQESKILSFNQKAAAAKEGHLNNMKVLYSGKSSKGPNTANARQIPQQPERILDAPDLLDDYYLNLLSWSSNNHLAVGLGGAVYLWNAGSGDIVQLCELESPEDYISSVAWIREGNFLAVGTSTATVQLWDVGHQKLIRTMRGHAARVGSLSWNAHILSSGSRSGMIHHHDVRIAQHHVATLANHSQEVCGLTWSPDGRYLASGGNDNMVNIWGAVLGHEVSPVHTFTLHQSAVKALSWCPWQPTLLATGGGTADRHIRFWNVTSGTCLHSVDTNSQVCSILWSKEYRELISGHGFSQNQLTIWKYPSMTRVTELTGHTARVLCLGLSPDGSTVASAAADETIRLWRCFGVDKCKKTTSKSTSGPESKPTVMSLSRGIR